MLITMSAIMRPEIVYQAQDWTHQAVVIVKIAPFTHHALRVYGIMTMVMYTV